MDLSAIFTPENDERPLSDIKEGGGFTGIFRTIAVVGDSLAAGDLESIDIGGPKEFHDFFDISWGSYIARMCGVTVHNFSRGAMTAREYCNSFADEKGYWDKSLAAQAYVLALGCNDLDEARQPVGNIGDIDPDHHRNAPTFAGDFGKIIQRYKEISPDAVFFLVTMPREPFELLAEEFQVKHESHRALMYDLAAHFTNTFVIDLAEYGPVHDKEFHRRFYTGGHLNAAGYLLTAKLIASYIDHIVRHNIEFFNRSGLIGPQPIYPKG